ncbi:MAG: DUF1501 domain-containing protein [Deltaproteobacteria bacterium]|nr:DUF1501 domain-containing protein [Deltaproteobacteria bacterium]
MAMTRRDLLRGGALAALGCSAWGGLERAVAAMQRPSRAAQLATPADTVVVALNLQGGNDGLNTVVPLRQYARYRQLRPTLALPRARLVTLTGYAQDFALNPGLRALAPLFTQGKVAVLNGIGCPLDAQGLFDHEASQQNFVSGEIYGTAPPQAPSGWLGRFLDGVSPGTLPAGIDFSGAPLLLSGANASPLSLSSIDGFGVYPSNDFAALYTAYYRLQSLAGASGTVATRHRALRQQVLELSGDLQAIHDAYAVAAGVTYPDTYTAGALRDCAALIAARRGVRALAVGLGGFDTHVDQQAGPPDTAAYHEALLGEAAEAVAAFYADLRGHGLAGKVVTLIFSEFGRRAEENNDLGTDHGLASVAFAIGDPVRGGVYGTYPDLAADALVLDGNLDVHTDFRAVYSTILARHLGADPEPILHGDFGDLGFLR